LKFQDLSLHPSILKSVEQCGFETCTPIQESAIPLVLEGRDVAGLAQTGTGKTAAFVVPLLDRWIRSKENRTESDEKLNNRKYKDWKPREFILVLVPTRELADQVSEAVEKFKGDADVGCATVYGGTSYDKQIEAIKSGIDFIVGTPGRLIDLYKSHVLDFRQVRAVVFDEADRMFDMGFRDDMKFILRRLPTDRQFLVFSATLNFEVLNVAYSFGAEPIECNVSRDQAKAEHVKDEILHVGNRDKPLHLLSLFKREKPKQAIIFSNFKNSVEQLSYFLNDNGLPSVAISSLLNQNQRNRVIEKFKSDQSTNILVATDLAARGLDVEGVDVVVNYELPDDPENYIHRIGRTGRAGQEGKAYSLVGERDVEALMRIEEYLKHKLPVGWIDDTDLLTEFNAFPSYDVRNAHKKTSGDRRSAPDRGRRPPRNSSQQSPPRGSGTAPHRPRREAPSESAEGSSSARHRDRSLGRHGRSGSPQGKGDSATGNSSTSPRASAPRATASQPPRKTNGKAPQRGRRHPAKGQKSRPVGRRNPKTVGQKISGFIKGLFGR